MYHARLSGIQSGVVSAIRSNHYLQREDNQSRQSLLGRVLGSVLLSSSFFRSGRQFSLRKVLLVAVQILERIETMHRRHLIHRDIKPGNLGAGARGTDTEKLDSLH